jgi:serine protease AprX
MRTITQHSRPVQKVLLAGAVLALLIGGFPSISAQSAQTGGKLSREVVDRMNAAGSDDMLPVIVETNGDPTALGFTRLHGRGGVVKARYASFQGYSAQIPAGQIQAFADDSEVDHISYDSPVMAHLDIALPSIRANTGYVTSSGLNGAGVGVAVIDTGMIAHDDLQRPLGQQIVEVEVVGHETGIMDYFGHGTHVAGIIGGNGTDSSNRYAFRTFKGIAPGSRLISIRALAPDGSGTTSDVLTAIDWAIANRLVYNIRVLNLSLGHPVYESYVSDPLCRAVAAANAAGLVVVVAAGNDGRSGSGFGTITSPANEPNVITVGAMNDAGTVSTADDVLAPYSSKGPTLIDHIVKPDLVAPGTHIVSLRAPGSYIDTYYHYLTLKLAEYSSAPSAGDKDGAYLDLSGTSMAAPMVAATAALMIQKEPTLNPATVKARLMASTTKDSALIFETGAGYLNVDGALKANGFALTAPSPVSRLSQDGYVYVQDLSLIWGDRWTDSLIWGDSKGAVYGYTLTATSSDIITTDGYIWGGPKAKCAPMSLVQNTEITSTGLIWGVDAYSLIWGDSSLNALTAVWGGGRGGGK